MTVTTEIGNWWSLTGSDSSVTNTVRNYLGDFVDDFDVDAIADDYRDAINDLLPEYIWLAGDTLYGPYEPPADWDPDWTVDFWERVEIEIDFDAIVQRHDISGDGTPPEDEVLTQRVAY